MTGRATTVRAAVVLLGPLLAAALVPAACQGALGVIGRAKGHYVSLPLSNGQMLTRVWLDVVRVQAPPTDIAAKSATVFAGVCFALTAIGWGSFARTAFRTGRGAVPLFAAVSLASLPVIVAVLAPDSRYLAYKLLMTTAPLCVVGLGLFARAALVPEASWGRVRRLAVAAVALLVIADTVSYQCMTRRRDLKHTSAQWNDPGAQSVAAVLRAEPRTSVVVALAGEDAWVSTGAFLYHGRHHDIRLAAPQQVWIEPLERFPAPQLFTSGPPSPGTLIVTRPEAGPPAGEVLFRSDSYLMVRLNGSEHVQARGR